MAKPIERQKALKLFLKRKPLRKIAEELNVTLASVEDWCKADNWKEIRQRSSTKAVQILEETDAQAKARRLLALRKIIERGISDVDKLQVIYPKDVAIAIREERTERGEATEKIETKINFIDPYDK